MNSQFLKSRENGRDALTRNKLGWQNTATLGGSWYAVVITNQKWTKEG